MTNGYVQWVHRSVTPDVALTVGHIGDPNAQQYVVITSYLHGDEDAGLMVVNGLLEQLEVTWRPAGLLKVIPVANRDAARIGSRTSPIDHLDANRLGLGDSKGQATERLVAALHAEAVNADLIICLHSFETNTLIAGIFTDPQDKSVRSTALAALAALQPDYILTVPYGLSYPSLDGAFCQMGVPCISIELPRIDLLQLDDLKLFVSKLIRLLELYGAATRPRDDHTADFDCAPINCYSRLTVRSESLGVWNPAHALGSTIAPAAKVGVMVTLPTFTAQEIRAPNFDEVNTIELRLLQIRPREVVRPNDILVGLGRRDDELCREIERHAYPSHNV